MSFVIYDELALNNGVLFKYTYEILNERMQSGLLDLVQHNKGKYDKSNLDVSLFVPAVVNCAFACELFMKSMLPKDTHGHELHSLFSKLDTGIQGKIQNATVDSMKKIRLSYGNTDFQNDLTENSNNFAEWRYFHEKSKCSANLPFISNFMNAIFSVAVEERNTLNKET